MVPPALKSFISFPGPSTQLRSKVVGSCLGLFISPSKTVEAKAYQKRRPRKSREIGGYASIFSFSLEPFPPKGYADEYAGPIGVVTRNRPNRPATSTRPPPARFFAGPFLVALTPASVRKTQTFLPFSPMPGEVWEVHFPAFTDFSASSCPCPEVDLDQPQVPPCTRIRKPDRTDWASCIALAPFGPVLPEIQEPMTAPASRHPMIMAFDREGTGMWPYASRPWVQEGKTQLFGPFGERSCRDQNPEKDRRVPPLSPMRSWRIRKAGGVQIRSDYAPVVNRNKVRASFHC